MIRRFLGRCKHGLVKWHIARKHRVVFGRNVDAYHCVFEGNNMVGYNSHLNKCHIGRGSYLGFNTMLNNVRIGKYSSLGPDLRAGLGSHPTSVFVSTHPAFYSDTSNLLPFTFHRGPEDKFPMYRYASENYTCEIGNDVWIGQGVFIGNGVTIGDGAIVGAGSVVLKDVPPYAIVAGAPARYIRNRFSDEQAASLLRHKWWDKSEQWIADNHTRFDDIESFIVWMDNQ